MSGKCRFLSAGIGRIQRLKKGKLFALDFLIYSLKHAGQNLALSVQEFIMLSFLCQKGIIKRISFAFRFQTSALPVQSRLVIKFQMF
jgi:hypothetical protein